MPQAVGWPATHDLAVQERISSAAGRAGIVAVARTSFEEKQLDKHFAKLMYYVTRETMSWTGVEFRAEGSGMDCTTAAACYFSGGPAGQGLLRKCEVHR